MANSKLRVRTFLAAAKHLSILMVTAAASHASPPPSFQGLGYGPGDNESFGNAISADGTTVVGTTSHPIPGNSVPRPFRWTQSTGMVNLGTLPGAPWSYATGVSGDGSKVIGHSYFTSTTNSGFLWTASSGMVKLQTPAAHPRAYSNAMSADGHVAVGQAGNDATSYPAYRWIDGATGTTIGSLAPGLNAQAHFASADGSVIVGVAYDTPPSFDNYVAFRWTSATGMVGLGKLPDGKSSRAFGCSANGSVLVGGASIESGHERAIRWTQAGGMQNLGLLPGDQFSYLQAVSADGNVAVGISRRDSPTINRAVFWNPKLGMVDLQSFLVSRGVNLTGWKLEYEATGISADGTRIVGSGNHNGLFEAFIATIPAYCAADLNNDDVVDNADFEIFVGPYCVLLCDSPEMQKFCPSDFNLDWVVDDLDFVAFARAYDTHECP